MKKRCGFTLIELVIVVAIVGILSTIAIPSFLVSQFRAKTSEARTNLAGIRTAQETFRSEFDNYVEAQENPPVFVGSQKQSWNSIPCPSGCDRDHPANCSGFACIGFAPSGLVYYQYSSKRLVAVAGGPAHFSAGARADLDGHGTHGSFTFRTPITPAGTSDLPDGVSSCDADFVPGGEVYDCAPNQY